MNDDNGCAPGNGIYPGDCELTQALLKRAAARRENEERGYVWKQCLPKAEPVELLLLDVDGVMTDGSLSYTDEGIEIKTFHSRDGLGMNMLQSIGVEIGIITARTSEALTRRARDLKLTHVYQGRRKKLEVYEELISELNLEDRQVAYMGDDWLDLALLGRVGFAATVADAVAEVREAADYVARRKGGHGAVREVCDLIIDAKGRYQSLLDKFLRNPS